MELDVPEPQLYVSYERRIKDPTYETRSVAPGSDHDVEKMVTTFVEST